MNRSFWLNELMMLVAFQTAALSPVRAEDALEISDYWRGIYQTTAEKLIVASQPEGPPLELVPQPLLYYQNPVRVYEQHGALYLWTLKGRPQFLGAIWSGADLSSAGRFRMLSHEGHSLAQQSLQATLGEQTMWVCEGQGVQWHKAAGDVTVAPSKPLRLTQMRRLVQGLEAKMHSENGELRLLPHPLYRYPENVPGAIDGAIFGFVMGTDPELFLIVEARQDGWHLAAARFTNEILTVDQPGDQIYRCEHILERTSTGPYWLNWDVERLPSHGQAQAATSEDQP